MPNRAKIFIGTTISIGVILLAASILTSTAAMDQRKLIAYLTVAAMASTMKVRLPGMKGTMSANFLIFLISIAELPLAGALIIGTVASAIQTLWRPRNRPKLVQVLFNVSALDLSIAAAYWAPRTLFPVRNQPGALAVSACVYFLCNALLVSTVLALINATSIAQIFRECHLWTYPYYLTGAAIAASVTLSGQHFGWAGSMMILPLMYTMYTHYRLDVEKRSQMQPVAAYS
jgi:hypothetical protein